MSRVVVFHSEYGCDTGCCGHVVRLDDGREAFRFAHTRLVVDGDSPRRFAERLVREEFGDEHVADLDWDACRVEDD